MSSYIGADISQHKDLGRIVKIYHHNRQSRQRGSSVSQVDLMDGLVGRVITRPLSNPMGILYCPDMVKHQDLMMDIISKIEKETGEKWSSLPTTMASDHFQGKLGDYDIDMREKTKPEVYWSVGFPYGNLEKWDRKRIKATCRVPWYNLFKKNQVDDVHYLWGKLIAKYSKVCPSFGDLKIHSWAYDQIIGFKSTVQKLFQQTQDMKGFSVSFVSSRTPSIYNRFALLTKDLPLPAIRLEGEPELPKTKITDPWDVDIPKIEEGLR